MGRHTYERAGGDERLRAAVAESHSIADVLRALSLDVSGANYRLL